MSNFINDEQFFVYLFLLCFILEADVHVKTNQCRPMQSPTLKHTVTEPSVLAFYYRQFCLLLTKNIRGV